MQNFFDHYQIYQNIYIYSFILLFSLNMYGFISILLPSYTIIHISTYSKFICHGACGISDFESDSTVESPARAHRCWAAARFEWVGGWLWDGNGHVVCDRDHLLACYATLLYPGFEVHSRLTHTQIHLPTI